MKINFRSQTLIQGLTAIDLRIADLEKENQELKDLVEELHRQLCERNIEFIAHSDTMMSNLISTMIHSIKKAEK